MMALLLERITESLRLLESNNPRGLILANKTTLIKELKEKGIPIPKGTKVADLEHRLAHWKSGKGYLFRLAVPSSRAANTPAEALPDGEIYWIPDSDYAKLIADTNMVFLLGRVEQPPLGVTIIDVPKDFNDRWG